MEQIYQAMNSSDYPKSKWSLFPTFLVVILLIIAYPVGIVLILLFTKWSTEVKLLLTFSPALILIFLISYLFFSLSNQRQDVKKKIQIQKESRLRNTNY